MSVEDWGSEERWYIGKDEFGWYVAEPHKDWISDHIFSTFAEAHAAYLDAVSCEAQSPFLSYTEPRCLRARGHQGPHRFRSLHGRSPLTVNPK